MVKKRDKNRLFQYIPMMNRFHDESIKKDVNIFEMMLFENSKLHKVIIVAVHFRFIAVTGFVACAISFFKLLYLLKLTIYWSKNNNCTLY